jgi:hypothetical protein
MVITQWYAIVSGLLLTITAAATVFALVPPSYVSSGTVIVMPPTHPTNAAGNPLLAFNSSLDTVALLLLQTLSSPLLPERVGLVADQDTVTVRNASIGASPKSAGQHPFISITAQSPEPARSVAIVSWVMDLARRDLADRQRELLVPKRKNVTLGTVVDPTPAKQVWTAPVSATGGVLLLGLMLTTTVAGGIDRAAIRRRRPESEFARVLPLVGVGDPPVTQKPQPAVPAARPAAVALVSGQRRQAG